MNPVVVGIISFVAVMYIFAPLFFSRKRIVLDDRVPASSAIGRMHELSEKLEHMAAEKEDLEFMHEMGKLSDEDYTRLLEENTAETNALSGKMKALKTKQAGDSNQDDA